MKSSCFLLFSLSLVPLPAYAQAKVDEAAAVVLPTVSRPDIPAVSLGLKASEALRTFAFPIQNEEAAPLKVFGVQTTSGLYVVDFPKAIPGKGSATVTLLYVARQNSTQTADLLSLLTDHGEKILQINHDREPAVQWEATSLQWQQGEAPVTKAVILTVAQKVSVPKSARAMGSGNTAAIEDLGDGRYRVAVTPASTAKAQQFPVFIQFVPALPGATAMISCAVVGKD